MFSYQTYTDQQLLQLLRKNDQEAFSEIYRRYWEQMSLYVLKVIRLEEEARDIVQEVFVSIWRRRQELEVKGTLIAYLLKSVRNLAIRYIENNLSQQRFLQTLTEQVQHLDLSGINTLELHQLEARIAAAVAALPAKMQEIYLLSRHENLSYKEIAQRLGIAETTVKKQVSNALKQIRTELGILSGTGLVYLVFLAD